MSDTGRYSHGLIIAAVTALALVSAHALRWYCDDVFITLRYAQQFLDGHGFVYNPGEAVQGYTHFLWLLLLTGADALGFDPASSSIHMGALAYAATVLVLALAGYRTARAHGQAGAVVPFAALAVAVNYECNVWATGGMETALFTFLTVAAFYLYFFSRSRRIGPDARLFGAGTLLTLATMTRPDGAVFYAVAGLFVAGRSLVVRAPGSRPIRDAVVFLAPLVLLYGPFAAWKISFYGDVLPNTYYAKSAYRAYWSQGFHYLWLYLRAYPTSMLCVAALPILLATAARAVTRPRDDATAAAETPYTAAAWVAFAGVVAYAVVFVARVGGDFMYARFVVPMLPFVYWLVEWSAVRLFGRRAMHRSVLFVVVALSIMTVERGLRDDLLIDTSGDQPTVSDRGGVVDEHFYYTTVYPLEEERRLGEALRPYFQGLDATVLLRGQACLGYYARFETCIENGGLTDSTIAHLPLRERGRVGHERSAPYDYLLAREVNLVFNRQPYRDRRYRLVAFDVDGIRCSAEIIVWDGALMRELHRRLGERIRFTPFESVLDGYIANQLNSLPVEQVREDFSEFREFYFDYNDDPARRQAFERRLEAGAGR